MCQLHSALIFNHKFQDLGTEVDTTTGPGNVLRALQSGEGFAGFAVSVSHQQKQHESVIKQWMDGITRLVILDYDPKPGNKAEEFDPFIFPLVIRGRRLIREMFNSLPYTCLIAVWLDHHVTLFLSKYSNA